MTILAITIVFTLLIIGLNIETNPRNHTYRYIQYTPIIGPKAEDLEPDDYTDY